MSNQELVSQIKACLEKVENSENSDLMSSEQFDPVTKVVDILLQSSSKPIKHSIDEL